LLYVALIASNFAALALAAYVIRGWRQDHLSHREEIAALNQARMQETADLLQRIQAPDQAVATHAGDTARPDPPPLNLDDDDQMLEAYRERLESLGVIGG
jgi:hypothetical protein